MYRRKVPYNEDISGKSVYNVKEPNFSWMSHEQQAWPPHSLPATLLMAAKPQSLEFHFKISLEAEGRRNKWAWPTQAEETVCVVTAKSQRQPSSN